MGPRSHWRTLPWDARCSYLVVLVYGLSIAAMAIVGPELMFFLASCIVNLTMAALILVLVYGVVLGAPRDMVKRLGSIALLCWCLFTSVVLPGVGTDLHLVYRVYRSGGPTELNDWAQRLIQQQQTRATANTKIDREQLPNSVRKHLPGWVTVGGTLWSDLVRVRIELGGGFFHYGIVIFPSAHAPPAEWWQRLLGWPPEVVIYQE